MIKIISNVDGISSRNTENSENITKIVKEIIENVKINGDKALFEYAEKFDNAKLSTLEVTKKEMEDAVSQIDAKFLETIKKSMKNIEDFHKNQLQKGFMVEKEGVILGQKVTPIEKVGIYVPGGKAVYPSTVLMNVIPAKIAGCKQITMVSPPGPDGEISNGILACAFLAGVDKFYKIGGAGAVAALAYGTETIEKVYKITGPGNTFVATAKKEVFGEVDIDMIAGPSEILVIADENANARIIASDLLSQAEHDPMASSILVTTSDKLAENVQNELELQIPLLSRSDICRQAIDENSYIILCKSTDECFEISNEIAPEHLEIMLENPFSYLPKIQNAGSIFLGKNTPEALGDYFAGVNHTLPTNGTAKFSSALGTETFMKKSTFVYYDEKTLEMAKDDIVRFATMEGLEAHAKSVSNRFEV
ncbi:MAG: histidinol dehydrogenase [Clostridia bacterium]